MLNTWQHADDSLNDSLKAYVDAQASGGDYGTPSEYVQELIAEDRERRYRELEQSLIHAHQAGGITLTAKEVEVGDIVDLLCQKRSEQRGRSA